MLAIKVESCCFRKMKWNLKFGRIHFEAWKRVNDQRVLKSYLIHISKSYTSWKLKAMKEKVEDSRGFESNICLRIDGESPNREVLCARPREENRILFHCSELALRRHRIDAQIQNLWLNLAWKTWDFARFDEQPPWTYIASQVWVGIFRFVLDSKWVETCRIATKYSVVGGIRISPENW